MTNHCNSNSFARFSKKELKGKALEVHSPAITPFKMKPLWDFCGSLDERIQFVPKFVAKMIVDCVVVFEDFENVILNSRM